ncbi:MAG: hypothetical protein IPK03_17555 [Bacteroidetes bacterium]|nr:hypothetical protein [Bacteroidota bacterium]
MFKARNRPFKFTTEVYYKHLWDVNQWDYQAVCSPIRYVSQNNAVAYATGVDFRVQGELMEGAESWVNLYPLCRPKRICRRLDFLIFKR